MQVLEKVAKTVLPVAVVQQKTTDLIYGDKLLQYYTAPWEGACVCGRSMFSHTK